MMTFTTVMMLLLTTKIKNCNEHENDPAVGHVGQRPILGAGMLYTVIKISILDTDYGTSANKGYFLGRVFKKHLMQIKAIGMTEDEADQTLQALVDDGTIEELGDDQYRPAQIHKIQELNWW